ncbi:hypothetical protein [Halovivax limisalsi]|uniref:hypothetical protein n=1 Tax=Halovivax limisalsi TaxID=1453760 RepID=UPI001FFCDC5B|nr:hypothetical protein [Halovivax limisalsi]
MTSRSEIPESGIEVVARFDGGCSWIADPDESMERASHALVADGDVWVVDPVDGDGVDEVLSAYGPVAGVVVALDRHRRDAAAIAKRHDVAVWLPDWFDGVADGVDAPIERFGATLADTGIESRVVARSRFWREIALFDPIADTLVVPESVGTAAYYLAGAERLGVHPVRRLNPPRAQLGDFDPTRILVGHGPPVEPDAGAALHDALDGSRRRAPGLYASIVREALPI